MPATPFLPPLSECLPPAQLSPAHDLSPQPKAGKSQVIFWMRESMVRACVRVCACGGGGGGGGGGVVAVVCGQYVWHVWLWHVWRDVCGDV